MEAVVPERAYATRRLHTPVCVFLICYGVAKLAELLGWSRLHAGVVSMLGLGSGAVTVLLLAGKCAELLLTVLAVLALTRRDRRWLLAALAAWTADLAVLAVVAGVDGDLGRLLEHGLSFLVFAGLLALTFAYGRARQPAPAGGRLQDPASGDGMDGTIEDVTVPNAGVDHAAHAADADVTRHDLPVRGSEATRMDLPVRRPDVTRHDLPIGGRRRWPPKDHQP